jgi:predicted enzyme related to lactoylglutathione lyase
MSETTKPAIGSIIWQDLTVKDASGVRDFYGEVVGWQFDDHDMGEYADYNVQREDGEVIAGICHARDANANIPPAWLLYVTVADVEASANRCLELGGKVLDGPRLMGESKFCIIQDPAGAILALIE